MINLLQFSTGIIGNPSGASELMKRAMVPLAASVTSGLNEILRVEPLEDAVRITTQCMYPSNGLVRVYLRGGSETVVASDNGEATGEALAAGVNVRNPDRLLHTVVASLGLKISEGVIHTEPMPMNAAPLAVLLVANAAKEVAQWLYEHQKIKRDRDFRRLLADFLKRKFDEQVMPAKIVGRSNKPHKFANVISFPNGRRLIIDPVANDPSSINARVVANMDIAALSDPSLEQRIVYDDDEKWSASDLNLLNVGAKVVPFSRSQDVIERVAAAQIAAAS